MIPDSGFFEQPCTYKTIINRLNVTGTYRPNSNRNFVRIVTKFQFIHQPLLMGISCLSFDNSITWVIK